MNHEDLLFYDIEVFKYDSLVVFMNYEGEEVCHIWNDINDPVYNGFGKLPSIVDKKILVGYNNHHYDDLIIYRMMRPYQAKQSVIKRTNDDIIAGNDSVLVDIRQNTRSMFTLDTMQQIDLSRPSLKKIEGNIGSSVMESEISFLIDRPLTEAEKEETLEYCRHDVETTVKVYKIREDSYFKPKEALVNMLHPKDSTGIDAIRDWKLNTTSLSAKLLLERPNRKWTTMRLGKAQKFYRNIPEIPEAVWDMWDKVNTVGTTKEALDFTKGNKVSTKVFGCEFVFAFGGLHGAAVNQKRFKDVMLLDVGSMYPSIIININGLEVGTEKYDGMRKERLSIKKTDPVRANALKLILNSVYGNLKSEYSLLYNPKAAISVCIYGQIALFDLCRRLDKAGYIVMNVNTDGVAFVDPLGHGDEWKEIQKDWEDDFDLYLELDEFDTWLQKDVNNYIAVSKYDKHVKTKGGECNKYASEKPFANNDARIIHMAMVDYLLFDKKIYKTFDEHKNEPQLFQYILRAGRTYQDVCDDDGNTYQNVNRIFPAKESVNNTCRLYKRRFDGGKVNFPDMPDKMYLFNDDLSKMNNVTDIIDLNHYYNVVTKKLEGWK